MDNLLLNLETEFYFITGVYLEGVSGLLFGLLFFSLVMYLIRFERKQNPIWLRKIILFLIQIPNK